MLPIAEINHKIMKLLDFDSYFVLCRVNKYNYQFVREDKHYQKFQAFHEDWLDLKFLLRLNRDANDFTFKFHRYKLALEYNCKKLVDRYYIPVHGNRRYTIMESVVKTDDLELYESIRKKLDLNCGFIYENLVYKYNLHNFYNKFLSRSGIPVIFYQHIFFEYIYTNNILHLYGAFSLQYYIKEFLQQYQFLTLPNIIYYIDILVKIIIKLQINYDIYTILVNICSRIPNERIKRKMRKYLKIHFPKSLRPQKETNNMGCC